MTNKPKASVVFIVPAAENLPNQDLISDLEQVANVTNVIHTGKLSEVVDQVRNAQPSVLGLDPGSFEWQLDAATLSSLPSVKFVCTSSTSFDWMSPSQLSELGVKVCNAPGFSSDSVAEYAVCMAIEIARRLPLVIKNNWQTTWASPAVLLKGKKAGVIGLGRIGRRMAEILHGLGLEVVYWSRSSRDDRFTAVTLEELFQTSDVIMPALVENDQTQQLLTRALIDSAKPSALLVGIGRVKNLWDEAHILEKVAHNTLGGYAFEGENAKPITEYQGNVWPLPAMAWQSQDSLDSLMRIWVETIKSASLGQPIHVVK